MGHAVSDLCQILELRKSRMDKPDGASADDTEASCAGLLYCLDRCDGHALRAWSCAIRKSAGSACTSVPAATAEDIWSQVKN